MKLYDTICIVRDYRMAEEGNGSFMILKMLKVLFILVVCGNFITERSFAEKTTIPLSNPSQMCIYYGYPTMVNGANHNLSKAVSAFSPCKELILGDGLEHAAHNEHEETQSIISGLMQLDNKRTIFGYIPLGIYDGGHNLSNDTMKEYVDEWLSIGANGIFLDEYGYDYNTTRERQNAIVDYIHDKGMSVMANAWEIESALGDKDENGKLNPAHLDSNDWYLAEDMFLSMAVYSSTNDDITKANTMFDYKKSKGVKMAVVSGVPDQGNSPTDHQTNSYKMAHWASVMYGFDSFQWTENRYSSRTNALRMNTNDAADIGTQFIEDPVNTYANRVHYRKTDSGTITVTYSNGVGIAGFTTKNNITTTGISITGSKLNLENGSSLQLGASVSYSDSSSSNIDSNLVSWESSNSNILSINDTGYLTAKTIGTVILTMKYNNYTTSTLVNVIPVSSSSGIDTETSENESILQFIRLILGFHLS
jgi:hypothetical protein